MIEAARELSQEPHTYWTDQLNNQDSIAGYHALGEEIWSQTKGEIDAFVHCGGHGGLPARGRHRAEAPQTGHQDRRRRTRGIPGVAGRPGRARTRSKESGSATCLHSGSRRWWTRSWRSRRTPRRTWRGASHGRRRSSRGRLPERTSAAALRVAEAAGAGRQGRHPDGRLRAEVLEHRCVQGEVGRGRREIGSSPFLPEAILEARQPLPIWTGRGCRSVSSSAASRRSSSGPRA